MVSKENSSAASQRASTQGSAASQRADKWDVREKGLLQNAEDAREKGLLVFLGNLPYDIKPGDIMEKVSGCLHVRVITETVVCEESDGTDFRYYDFLKTYAFATLDDLKNVDRLLNMPIKFGERFARTYLAMPFTSKRRKVG